MLFSDYARDALQLSEEELNSFGGRSSAFRTTVTLKYVVDLHDHLKDLILGQDLFSKISPIYQEALDEDQKEQLVMTATLITPENLTALVNAYYEMLKAQFMEFAEPVALVTLGEANMISGGDMMTGTLENATLDDGTNLYECEWFCENFPDDIEICHLIPVYKELKRLLDSK